MNIAVSACLMGAACRYDGAAKPCDEVLALKESHNLVPFCPEVLGGLVIPHPAHEIISWDPLRVCDCTGADNTKAFVRGAEKALSRLVSHNCSVAIMKSKSPSCGCNLIYDGTFSGTLIKGNGIATQRFIDAGVQVYDEKTFAKHFR